MDKSKGGTAAWGTWMQDKKENVELRLQVPSGTRGRNIHVGIKSSALQVVVAGEVVLEGQLEHKVIADECGWQLDGAELVITLNKEKEGWWSRIVMQDEPVDTSKFDDVPFMLGDMEDYQHEDMRDRVSRMLGTGSHGSASVF